MTGSARALVVGGLLVAAAAAAFLVADPFGGGAVDVDRRGADGAAPDEAAGTTSDEATRGERPSLSLPSFDRAGPGAVRVRLLAFKDKSPLADKPVRLVRETGEATEVPTGADGVVVFGDVPAGRNLRLEVTVPPYAPVVVKGVDVRAGQTTTLDDLLLGSKVVLRGHVVDAAGKPIPGAAVAAYSSRGMDLTEGVVATLVTEPLRIPSPADEAQTDEAGLFELASLVPGRYRLMTKRAGYAMNHQSDLVVPADRPPGPLKIVLGPPAKVSGTVADEGGKPIANATVVAIEWSARGPRPESSFRKDFASTGADGRYLLDTLNLGVNYVFGVVAQGWAPVFDTQGLVVDAEQVRDFVLVRGGAVGGRVLDAADGKPIEGARVMVVVGRMGGLPFGGRRGGGATGADTSTSTGVATTDAQGAFRIEGLRPGPVMVGQVKVAGYASFNASAFPPPGNAWGEVVAGETLEVEARLVAGGSVTGRVTSAVDGSPVGGAQVIAASQWGFFQGYPSASADSDGVYRIEGIPGGTRFSVVATAPGFAAPDPWDEANQLTMPTEGGELSRDVALSAAGSVEGVVTTSRGEPVAGVRVRTRPAPGEGGGGNRWRGAWRQMLPSGGTVVLTDAEGRYRIEDVAADGKLVVEATADEVVPTDSAPFEVRVGQTVRVNVVLLGGGTLRGRVVEEGGRALSGVWVRAGHVDDDARAVSGFRADALLDPRTSATTDSDGRFEITRLRPGQTLLKAEHEGYVTFYRRDLQVQPDATIDRYVVTLARGESISGLVKGEDGRPLENARVMVTRQASMRFGAAGEASADGAVEPTLSDVTDAGGRFEVGNVPGGEPWNVVVAMAPGHRGFWGTNEETAIRRAVPAGERNVEFTLRRSTPGDFRPPGGGGPRPAPPAPPPPSGAGAMGGDTGGAGAGR